MDPLSPGTLPYCGAPPAPGGVVWNADPILGAVLLAMAIPALLHAGREGRILPAAAGWSLLALLLISPLCNLSVALFSARVLQHLLLTLVAAPLIAMALPARGRRQQVRGSAMVLAPLAFALAFWLWHLPAPYAATFHSHAIYWVMQASLVASAVWLWHVLLMEARHRAPAVIFSGIATAAQGGLLGALLTLAPRPLFAVHLGTTTAWGLTPLEDQQLGGLLMWVPGGMAFAGITLAAMAAMLRRDVREVAAPRIRP